jgi:hypothetical protein
LPENWCRSPDVIEVSLEVDVHDLVPLLLGHLPYDAVPVDASIADQDIQSTELLDDLLHHLLSVVEV